LIDLTVGYIRPCGWSRWMIEEEKGEVG